MHVVSDLARTVALNQRRRDHVLPHVNAPLLGLRVLSAAALGFSSYVHIHLANSYPYSGGWLTGTQLFYAQGVVAAVVGAALLLTGNRLIWLVAALLGIASFAAVMTYRYADIGAIGPIPNMYDPTWQPSPDKLASAAAEAALPVLWFVSELLRRVSRPAPATL